VHEASQSDVHKKAVAVAELLRQPVATSPQTDQPTSTPLSDAAPLASPSTRSSFRSSALGSFRGNHSNRLSFKDSRAKVGDTSKKPVVVALVGLGLGESADWPGEAHRSLNRLVKQGLVDHVIECDSSGLVRLVGVPREKLIELTGNRFDERCLKCGTVWSRNHDTTVHNSNIPKAEKLSYYELSQLPASLRPFATGARCERERTSTSKQDVQQLKAANQKQPKQQQPTDSSEDKSQSCNFPLISACCKTGQPIKLKLINQALRLAVAADILLVLGADVNKLPFMILPAVARLPCADHNRATSADQNGATSNNTSHVVLVSERKCPVAHVASLVVHTTPQEFLLALDTALGLNEPPPYRLIRLLTVETVPQLKFGGKANWIVKVSVTDEHGHAVCCMSTIEAHSEVHGQLLRIDGTRSDVAKLWLRSSTGTPGEVVIRIYFSGHFVEPVLELHHDFENARTKWRATLNVLPPGSVVKKKGLKLKWNLQTMVGTTRVVRNRSQSALLRTGMFKY
jgi:NAD-dependent SIR2 family protein deacetylase